MLLREFKDRTKLRLGRHVGEARRTTEQTGHFNGYAARGERLHNVVVVWNLAETKVVCTRAVLLEELPV